MAPGGESVLSVPENGLVFADTDNSCDTIPVRTAHNHRKTSTVTVTKFRACCFKECRNADFFIDGLYSFKKLDIRRVIS